MRYGYVRANSEEHKTAQINFLQDKVDKIIIEEAGEELNKLLDILQPNDTLYVYDMDRLTRRIGRAIEIINILIDKNIELYTHKGDINLRIVAFELDKYKNKALEEIKKTYWN